MEFIIYGRKNFQKLLMLNFTWKLLQSYSKVQVNSVKHYCFSIKQENFCKTEKYQYSSMKSRKCSSTNDVLNFGKNNYFKNKGKLK